MGSLYIAISVAGFCWGFWPLLMRSANVVGPGASFVISASALIPVAITWAMRQEAAPNGVPLLKLVIAGLIMGIGMVAFNFAGTSRLAGIGTVTSIVQALTIVVVVIGGAGLFGEGLSVSKVIGTLLLLAGVFILRPIGN